VLDPYKGKRNPRKSLRPEGLSCSKDCGAGRFAARLPPTAGRQKAGPTQANPRAKPFAAQGKQE